jgi:hypothetical protein
VRAKLHAYAVCCRKRGRKVEWFCNIGIMHADDEFTFCFYWFAFPEDFVSSKSFAELLISPRFTGYKTTPFGYKWIHVDTELQKSKKHWSQSGYKVDTKMTRSHSRVYTGGYRKRYHLLNKSVRYVSGRLRLWSRWSWDKTFLLCLDTLFRVCEKCRRIKNLHANTLMERSRVEDTP